MVFRARHHAGDAARSLVERRTGDRDILEEPGASLLRVPGQELVEVGPCPDRAEARERRQVGPGQLDPAAAADDAQALVAQPAIVLAGGYAHRGEGLDRAWGEPVAADLLPGKARLL